MAESPVYEVQLYLGVRDIVLLEEPHILLLIERSIRVTLLLLLGGANVGYCPEMMHPKNFIDCSVMLHKV